MLKSRIIACLTVKEGVVVQSIGFSKFLPVGRPEIAIEFLNSWGVDEIILLDISAGRLGRLISCEMITNCSKKCFVPLTAGGGITSVEEAAQLLHAGADKVTVNSAALVRPELIQDVAKKFGEQCVVVSIDAKKLPSGEYGVFRSGGTDSVGIAPVEWAQRVRSLGAGEILISSIDRDGSKLGYDLELTSSVASAVDIPVIALGGVGHPQHFIEGLQNGAAAVAAGNFFHFSEHSVITAKSFIAPFAEVRLDTYADYSSGGFLEDGRVSRKKDKFLQELRFVHYEEEVI